MQENMKQEINGLPAAFALLAEHLCLETSKKSRISFS
jgi:hypothetical protein